MSGVQLNNRRETVTISVVSPCDQLSCFCHFASSKLDMTSLGPCHLPPLPQSGNPFCCATKVDSIGTKRSPCPAAFMAAKLLFTID